MAVAPFSSLLPADVASRFRRDDSVCLTTSTAVPVPHQRQVTVLDLLVEHLLVLDGELATHRVVVEGPGAPGRGRRRSG